MLNLYSGKALKLSMLCSNDVFMEKYQNHCKTLNVPPNERLHTHWLQMHYLLLFSDFTFSLHQSSNYKKIKRGKSSSVV